MLSKLGKSLSRQEMKKIQGGVDLCGGIGKVVWDYPLGCCSGASCSMAFGEPPRCYDPNGFKPCPEIEI